ncbi:DUF72 domain-containing protein [Granulicella sibirica]|uniref:DUF72 domain-containing protein n=1 Tax=Granulicella sibirica TaxID=2479048 RepID=A0A4Q0SYH9_9BACT|nr:DUF72 domain-containing protein [Granulicella sibirica]RXH54251.1 hypothetical protein GRAN_4547 [Granulicella sibirica]
MPRIGTAGWTIPRDHAAGAPAPGTHLERYAHVLNCVEINSSFYKPHRLTTWQRWAASTPGTFRFSVKFPKAITHTAKLTVPPGALDAFALEAAALGEKLGPVLVQLPPSLRFEDCPAAEFFEALRDRFLGQIAFEPRHATWFTRDADELLTHHRIARVAADPPRQPNANPAEPPTPGGWSGLAYFRLHGSPRTYYSNYEPAYLATLAKRIAELSSDTEVWVIFDNTALGHAFTNALDLQRLLTPKKRKGAAEATPFQTTSPSRN